MSHKQNLKQFIIEEFIPNGENEILADDLNLIESGILDSLAVLKLVAFVEDSFDIALEPDEIDPENLNTINAIYSLIETKIPQPA